MGHLLDTHTLLWFLQGDLSMPVPVRRLVADNKMKQYVSIATIWEIAIKTGLGKLHVPYSLDDELPKILNDNGMTVLPITFAHLQLLSDLPQHHRDPFDRLLIAQAMAESLRIVGRDTVFDVYPVPRLWPT